MYKIEYSVGINEHGRPCIELPLDYEQRPEDRFFVVEVATYMLHDLLKRNKGSLDPTTVNAMDEAQSLLGQLGDEVATILHDGMRIQGELNMATERYHIHVDSKESRDALPDENILHNNALFDRVEGLKVCVQYYHPTDFIPINDIYELKNGITNEHWVLI